MRLFAAAIILAMPLPLAAQVPTPERPVTDPKSLSSPANPKARAVPIDDLGTSRQLRGASWSADGKHIIVATNLSGRFNLWQTDAGGSWPVQIAQSDDGQSGAVATRDGAAVLFEQDVGGNEYADIFRVPAGGGPVVNLTNTPDRDEGGMLVSRFDNQIALSTKLKSEGQSNLAIMRADGSIAVLTREADPQFNWSPVAFVDGGRAIIANRSRGDSNMSEVYRVSIADRVATKLLGKDSTVYLAADASPDGMTIAVTTNQGGNQRRAAVYDVSSKGWRWLKPTPWAQSANVLTDITMIVSTSTDARVALSRVDLATLAETPLALPPGLNRVVGDAPLSPDGTTLLVSHSAANTPGELYRYDLASDTATQVTRLAMGSLAPQSLPTSSVVTYKSFDGTLISAVVTMPPNLKRDGSHSAIVIPHGGPTSQSLDGYSQNAAAFASRGHIVIQPNFRGSTGYGTAFQRANIKDLGGGDLKDTIAAKAFLVASGYVDPKRVGIFGGSYGGFMTLMAIGKAPDEFAAAVQWFGIINWRTMYRDQDERLKAYQRSLIGTPEDNAAVYDAASPLSFLGAAKAPLLTIQGENDIRVPRGQAQEVHDLLKAKGNVVETIYYPAEGHGFQKRENQLDSLRRTAAWFDRYLAKSAR
jgi:dipeptidyl aminopeptidase/acylaminoacyl peptidase